MISQDSPRTVRVTMTSRVVLGLNMAPLDSQIIHQRLILFLPSSNMGALFSVLVILYKIYTS